MKSILATALLAGLLGECRAKEEVPWLTSYEQARKQAKAEGKVILADFTGSDWCGWCIKLDEEVFSKAEFQKWAQEHVVLLELDFPHEKEQSAELKAQNEELRQRFSVQGYPTVLFLDAEGNELGRSGYRPGGPGPWLAHASTFLPADQKETAGWLTSYPEALKQSKATGKPILADFTGSDWCGWCIKLSEEVFETEEFRKWAAENVVLLEVDFPSKKEQTEEVRKQNEALQKKFRIEGYPTIVFLTGDGKEIGRSGYLPGGPKKWIADAEKQGVRRTPAN